MTTVLLTGAAGFIARACASVLARDGVRLIGVARSAPTGAPYDRTTAAALGDSLGPLFREERVDAVVHCANDTGRDSYAANVGGTTRWITEAMEAGVRRQIFLSSLSAMEDAAADYGRAKWVLEQAIESAGGANLRLGVVIGNGGMFQRMKDSLRRSPVVPLLDGGRSRVHIVDVGFLADFIRRCLLEGSELRPGRPLFLQQPTPVLLGDVLTSIRRHYGYRCRFVPVPSLPVLWGVKLAERIPGVTLPVSSTNLRGLRRSARETFPSDFLELGGKEESLDVLVARAASAEGRG